MLFAIAIASVMLPTRALVVIAAFLAVVMPLVVGVINSVTGGADGESTSRIAIMLGWHHPFPLWAAFLGEFDPMDDFRADLPPRMRRHEV